MKVECIGSVFVAGENERYYSVGETLTLKEADAAVLIGMGVVKEVKTTTTKKDGE